MALHSSLPIALGTVRVVIDVILPALHEAMAVRGALRSLHKKFSPIVVDNGSTDATGEIAARLGARVIVEAQRGFGAACLAGLRAATSDVVCFMDCDGSLDGAELLRVATPIERGTNDLVLGARHPITGRAWPRHARVANPVIAGLVNRRWNLS